MNVHTRVSVIAVPTSSAYQQCLLSVCLSLSITDKQEWWLATLQVATLSSVRRTSAVSVRVADKTASWGRRSVDPVIQPAPARRPPVCHQSSSAKPVRVASWWRYQRRARLTGLTTEWPLTDQQASRPPGQPTLVNHSVSPTLHAANEK